MNKLNIKLDMKGTDVISGDGVDVAGHFRFTFGSIIGEN